MKLFISEPEERHQGAILVHDEALNDIAEFYHNEHATVGQSYETALALAQKLVTPTEPQQFEVTDEMVLEGAKAMVRAGQERRAKGQDLPTRLQESRACLDAALSLSRPERASPSVPDALAPSQRPRE